MRAGYGFPLNIFPPADANLIGGVWNKRLLQMEVKE